GKDAPMFEIFNTEGFVPRRICGDWPPVYVWLHVVSNIIIAISYISIPLALAYILRKRTDIPFRLIFLMFILFIVTCGVTHIMDALMFYWPAYRLNGWVLTACATASATTVILLWKCMPLILKLPSPDALTKQLERTTKA